LRSAEDFLKSPAAAAFDILALHPYAWPDFPPPEKWMPDYVGKVRALMEQHRAAKPIWFTEIGAPHDGNPGGFFGYPSSQVFDRGLSRDEHAAYLLKCHLIAFRLGVEKVFWYNYQDGGSDPEYAEHHFGMVDYWGYPKPSYSAYYTMSRLLRGKTLQPPAAVAGNVQIFRFAGGQEDCIVAWTYPAAARTVPLATLGIAPADVTDVENLIGTPVAHQGDSVSLSGSPIYVLVRHRTPT